MEKNIFHGLLSQIDKDLKNKSVKKLEKDLDYFKKLINKNKKIEGILVRKTPEDLVFRKNQLN